MTKNKKYYVDPNELHAELAKYQSTDIISERLGQIFINMTYHILNHSNFKQYNDNLKDDMRSHAIFMLMKYVHNCDPTERSPENCFNYVSTCIFNAYRQVLKDYYRDVNLKNDLITMLKDQFINNKL